jgi:lipopolysaccharide export system protein LptA
MGNPIGTINVRVNSGSPVTQRVSVSSNTAPVSVALAPTAKQSLKSMTDLTIPGGANTGDIIIYDANTNSFTVESASQGIPDIDGGTF